MKLKKISTVGATLAGLFALSSMAQAVMITGSIDIGAFNSSVVIDKAANTVTFVDDGPPAGNAQVNNATGGFAAFFGDMATYSNFTYDPLIPVNPLWTLVTSGSFFNLSAITSINEAGTGLVLTGTGTIFAAGFDPTPGSWSFSADQATSANAFTFSSQTASVSVPDGGATVALLGLSLIGLTSVRRFIK